jgi:hypothetical protein
VTGGQVDGFSTTGEPENLTIGDGLVTGVLERVGWQRVVGVVIFALFLSCSGEREPRVFKCYKQGRLGGPWRYCAPKLDDCPEVGCFERAQAYCFPYLLKALTAEQKDAVDMICVPTERECEEWNRDRKEVVNRSLGPCVLARPDEYPGGE